MNYDDTKRLLELQEANAERFKQMADDLSFIRSRMEGSKFEETQIKEDVSEDKPRRRREEPVEEPQVTIFNDDDNVMEESFNTAQQSGFNTQSSFTTKSSQPAQNMPSVDEVYRMFCTLMFVALERPKTFEKFINKEYEELVQKLGNKSKLEYIYAIVNSYRFKEIDKSLEEFVLNGQNMYQTYVNFKD